MDHVALDGIELETKPGEPASPSFWCTLVSSPGSLCRCSSNRRSSNGTASFTTIASQNPPRHGLDDG
jgi:hypothetical protein